MNNLKLSIVTINYNNANGLKETMASVANQNFQKFEYIVVDGASTDDSLEIIKSFNLPNLKWVSERDSGIYNAMNKGIKMAKGNYLLFLNSGDYFYNDEVLFNVIKHFSFDISFLSGHLFYMKGDEVIIRKHPNCISFSYLISKSISHPSTFIKKEMFEKYGLYNESNKIVSDWEFFFKVIGLNGESFLKLDQIITVFDTSGVSSNEESLELVEEERNNVLENYLKPIFNNEFDTFLFNNFKTANKRVKYLKNIEKSFFLRKVATLFLSIISFFIKK